jgi:cytochrome c-type biogenesis protein CcmH
MRRALYALLLAGLASAASAQVQTPKPPIPLDARQEAQYRALLLELRCLVCQNESLAESQAPLAADLRYEIRGLIAKGASDAQVKRYLVARYGEFVLYRPRLEPRTLLLWSGPFLLLLVAGATVWVYARRRTAASSPTVDEDALRRLLEEQDR